MAITARVLRELVESGAKSLDDLGIKMSAGSTRRHGGKKGAEHFQRNPNLNKNYSRRRLKSDGDGVHITKANRKFIDDMEDRKNLKTANSEPIPEPDVKMGSQTKGTNKDPGVAGSDGVGKDPNKNSGSGPEPQTRAESPKEDGPTSSRGAFNKTASRMRMAKEGSPGYTPILDSNNAVGKAANNIYNFGYDGAMGFKDTYKAFKANPNGVSGAKRVTDSIKQAYTHSDGKADLGRIAGSFGVAAAGARIVSGGGLYKDANGRTDLAIVPFV